MVLDFNYTTPVIIADAGKRVIVSADHPEIQNADKIVRASSMLDRANDRGNGCLDSDGTGNDFDELF